MRIKADFVLIGHELDKLYAIVDAFDTSKYHKNRCNLLGSVLAYYYSNPRSDNKAKIWGLSLSKFLVKTLRVN